MLCLADNYDWCIVSDTGYDVILLAGIAVIVACVCQGRLSNLMVLVAGRGLPGFDALQHVLSSGGE